MADGCKGPPKEAFNNGRFQGPRMKIDVGWSIFSQTKTASDSGMPSRGPVQFETPFCLSVNSWWKLRGIAAIAILQFYFRMRKFANGNSSTHWMMYIVFFSNPTARICNASSPSSSSCVARNPDHFSSYCISQIWSTGFLQNFLQRRRNSRGLQLEVKTWRPHLGPKASSCIRRR